MLIISLFQSIIGSSRPLTKLAIKVKRQCEEIISYNIGKTNDIEHNGEKWFLSRFLSNANHCVIDVGANHGEWTTTAYHLSSEDVLFYTYEPDKRALEILSHRLSTHSNVFIYNCAMSDRVGDLEIFISDDSDELTTAAPLSDKSYVPQKVKATTIDNEVDRLNLDHINLIKIDTEGYEGTVLQGATKSLQKEKIDCIQFEYGRNWRHAGHTLTSVVEFLQSYGYRTFLLQPDHLLKINTNLIGEYFRYSNFISLRESKVDEWSSYISYF